MLRMLFVKYLIADVITSDDKDEFKVLYNCKAQEMSRKLHLSSF